jgi:radical SAM superfamily enzyme YgiQ (UPF0313 family)
MTRKIRKILLIQPNYAWLNKRTWPFPPYTLCLLKATLKDNYEVEVFDPNLRNLSEDEVTECLSKIKPDLVGVTSVSTEYFDTTKLLISLIRKTLPDAMIIFGGVIPTVLIEESMQDRNVDYWLMGEGEESFPKFIEELENGTNDFSSISGLAYLDNGKACINEVKFIKHLDKLPFPDYTNIKADKDFKEVDLKDYGHIRMKYAPGLLPRNHPFAVTITSRGCPYRCIFCAGRTVSGDRVRYRSAENVLAEIDVLYKKGIKEVIFLDDHFLADKKRATEIMNGILKRNYGITWKCVNVTAWLLDKEILELMLKSGCNFLVVSIESGNMRVLKDIIKKPIKLNIIPPILKLAKSMGFDILANFVVGFPGETWQEIRETFLFAEKLDVDIANFHIATPLPKTELMEICMQKGLLPSDYIKNISSYSGYGKGIISTDEFSPFELEVLRSFEWDRINFLNKQRKGAIARICGITMQELEDWRVNTRRNLGVNNMVKNIMKHELSSAKNTHL